MWLSMFLTTICVFSILQVTSSTLYVDFEHPNVTYWNTKYYAYVNITAQRRSRQDPIHYVSAHSECLTEFGNEILVDIYFYEFRSNEYRRGFMEIHYKLCDWLQKEKHFLPYLIKFLPIKTCPFPKGEYHFVDISLPDLPYLGTFPFKKGRVFMNASNSISGERVIEGYIDMEIKEKTQGRKY